MRTSTIRNTWKIIAMLLLASGIAACGGGGSGGGIPPNGGDVITDLVRVKGTTAEKTVEPGRKLSSSTLDPSDPETLLNHGYGSWSYAGGASHIRRSLIPGESLPASPSQGRRALLRFFAITDVHITDMRSPAQFLDYSISITKSGLTFYAPSIPYSTQFFDATIKTVNTLHRDIAFDFGMFLGDASSIGQYNEVRWYLDVIDGKMIHPDSDPRTSATTDYLQSFKAAGLDPSIGWYQTLGNHDHFWQGTYNSNAFLNGIATGSYTQDLSALFFAIITDLRYVIGIMDPSSAYAGVKTYDPLHPPVVNANPDRWLTHRKQWLEEFFRTSSFPTGHGFQAAYRGTDSVLSGCYSFEPKGSAMPIKMIVLDDTDREPHSGLTAYGGYLDRARFEWLQSELLEGQANGKLMIVAAHIPIGVDAWDWASDPSEQEVIAELRKHPNLVVWISGHRHLNTVTPIASADPTHPENGFWVVETASLKDFPQQFRTFDIMLNPDDTLSVFATDVDPALDSSAIAQRSRTLSVAFYQVLHGASGSGGSGTYNAELLKRLAPSMQTKLRKLLNG